VDGLHDPVTTDDDQDAHRRRRRRSRSLLLCGLALAALAVGVIALQTRSGESLRVAAAGGGNPALSEPTIDSAPTTTTATPTEETTTTSAAVQVPTSVTRPRPTASSTTTTAAPAATTTSATVTDQAPRYSQGPALPTMKEVGNYASPDHYGDKHYLPLFIAAQDDDGWISQFVVDWGDGSAPLTLAYNPFPCKATPPSGWPAGNYVSLPSDTTNPLVGADGQPVPSTEHFYVAAGTYTVTVTVRSTACDGSQPQEGTGTMTWSVRP
jgi:hypothetical protein